LWAVAARPRDPQRALHERRRPPCPEPLACPGRPRPGRVLAGGAIDRDEARAILASGDEEILDLLAAAYRVRHRAFGTTVQLFFLMNAKPEDCGYCSQSKVSEAEIPRYNLLSAPKLMEAAKLAAERPSGSRRRSAS